MRRYFSHAVISICWGISFTVIFTACSSSKKIASTPSKPAPANTGLKKEDAYMLMNKLKGNVLRYKWISAHFSVDITKDSSEVSFNGVVRMRKDSVIWMTVSAALGAYTALHAKLDADSIMYIDHPDERYFKGTYDYLDTLLREDVDFDLIQSVMAGKTVDFYHDTSKMKAYFDGTDYILSTVTKRRYKRLIYRNRTLHSRNDAQLIWIDSSDFRVKKIRLEDFITKHTFEATYEDFQKADSGSTFPMHIHYVINTGKKTINIDLRYKKIYFTNSESIPFNIPKKYVPVRY